MQCATPLKAAAGEDTSHGSELSKPYLSQMNSYALDEPPTLQPFPLCTNIVACNLTFCTKFCTALLHLQVYTFIFTIGEF